MLGLIAKIVILASLAVLPHLTHGIIVLIKCDGEHLLKDFRPPYNMRLLISGEPLMLLEAKGFADGEEKILKIIQKTGHLSSGSFETSLDVDLHTLPLLKCDLFGRYQGIYDKTIRFSPEVRLKFPGPQKKDIRCRKIEDAIQPLSRVECSSTVSTNQASWSWEARNKSSDVWGPVSSDLVINEPLAVLDDSYEAKSSVLVFGNQTLRCSLGGKEVGRISVCPNSSAKGQNDGSSLVLIVVIFVSLVSCYI